METKTKLRRSYYTARSNRRLIRRKNDTKLLNDKTL
jgi:hypothetical protein